MPPLNVPLTKGQIIAAVTLVLIWLTVPNLSFRRRAVGDQLFHTEPVTEGATKLPLAKIHSSEIEEGDLGTSSDQTLTLAQAEKLCFHYHLEPYNASAAIKGQPQAQISPPPQRRIYDLLLITATTSADMLELRLASMYQHVDYIVMLEAPSIPTTKDADADADASPDDTLPLSGAPVEEPSVLDKIWTSHLSAYQSKIIRHSLSQHSHDFKSGLDHAANTRNALYTRVIPLLTGAQKVQLGDVLLVSDVEELVRPITMRVLRHCHIPERTTIRTRKYWYSYQWMKVDGPGTTPDAAEDKKPEDKKAEKSDGAENKAKKKKTTGNEWWPHPQATVYQGADTVLPDDLRKNRDQDQYVFGDGGWTCYLCYSTITETLAKIGEMGVVWHNGPRWKGAGRVVDRVSNGIDV